MKKYLIIFIISFALGLLLWASMVAAKQTTMSTYYPSSSGQYSKVLLVNGAGGPDSTNFCAQIPSASCGTPPCYGTPGQAGVTFINAGTIFTDQYSGYMEICKSDGSVTSYVGACLNRFSMNGTTTCPNHYTPVVNHLGNPFPGVTSYSCCFSNLSSDATASNGIARSGCFSVFSNSNSVPAPCSSVDPNAYDMGCQCFQNGCSDVRTCCFNSGNGLSLQAPPSTCKTAAGVACSALSAPTNGSCGNPITWGPNSPASTCNGTLTYTPPICGGSAATCSPVVVPCNDGNPCHQQICTNGACSNPNEPDGFSCGINEYCLSGTCMPGCFIGGTMYPGGTVDPGNSCLSCQPATSSNSWSDVPNGTVCGGGNECDSGTCCTPVAGSCSAWSWSDSGNTCNGTRTYTAPVCLGSDDPCMSTLTQTVNCNDGNPCHQQICSGGGTCSYPNVGNGTGCGGGNECDNGTCCTPVSGSCSVWTWNDSGNTCNGTRTYTSPSCNGADDACRTTLTQTVSCDTNATCSGGGICTCNSGYNGAGTPGTCVLNTCSSTIPANATACSGTPVPATNGAANTVVGTTSSSCAGAACTYYCDSGYNDNAGSCALTQCYQCTQSHCYVTYIAGVTYECAGPVNSGGAIYSPTDLTTSALICSRNTCNGSGCTPSGCPMTSAYTCTYGAYGVSCGEGCVPSGICSGTCGGGSGFDSNCGTPCTNNTACTCTPDCAVNGYNCGSDGCGGSCGTCDTNATCSNPGGGTCSCNSGYTGAGTPGTCVCVPSCSGVSCGSGANSCGSSCCNGSVVPSGHYCCEYMGAYAICITGEPCDSSGACGTGSGYWGGGCSDACGTCNPTYACGSTAGTCSISGASCTATAGTCSGTGACCTSSNTCSTLDTCSQCGGDGSECCTGLPANAVYWSTLTGGVCPACTPDCSCAASTCSSSTCTDPVCGTSCPGVLTCGNTCASVNCADVCYQAGGWPNGCITCDDGSGDPGCSWESGSSVSASCTDNSGSGCSCTCYY